MKNEWLNKWINEELKKCQHYASALRICIDWRWSMNQVGPHWSVPLCTKHISRTITLCITHGIRVVHNTVSRPLDRSHIKGWRLAIDGISSFLLFLQPCKQQPQIDPTSFHSGRCQNNRAYSWRNSSNWCRVIGHTHFNPHLEVDHWKCSLMHIHTFNLTRFDRIHCALMHIQGLVQSDLK